jgi:ribonuclease HII
MNEIGVDESGYGPLFGRVYSAAVILPESGFDLSLLKDSKKFHSKKKINMVADYIKENAKCYSINYQDEKEVDDQNILEANQTAIHLCLDDITTRFPGLDNSNTIIFMDGVNFRKYRDFNHKCVIKGDSKIPSISAASILAKTERDKYILGLCEEFPELNEKYDLVNNKGYGTAKHLAGIKTHGLTPYHRKSFCKKLK